MCENDTFSIAIQYLSPEAGQITTPGINANGVAGVSIVSSAAGNTASMVVKVIASASNSGVNTFYLTGTDNGTLSQITQSPITLNIRPLPQINFTYNPSSFILANTPVTFTNNSTNCFSPTWDFGDGSPTSTLINPTHTYTQRNTYSVKLSCTNSVGCSNSENKDVKILLGIEEPNVFTPNGDGVNDKLIFKYLEDYSNSNLTIFNRWGNKIYESLDYKNDWNGGTHPAGAYYYILKIPNEIKDRKGFVEMIK